MSSLQAASTLLCDIADAGAALLARPLIVNVEARREQIAGLRARLDDFKGTPGERYLNYFAPLLLTAIERALYFRYVSDETRAAKFDRLVGGLITDTRDDARAALAAMSA